MGWVALTPSDAATGGIEWDRRCNYWGAGCARGLVQEAGAARVGVRLVTHLRRPVERTRRKETPCTTTAEALRPDGLARRLLVRPPLQIW